MCIDDEIPFEIPAGWEWTRLNSIAIDSADGPFGSNLKKEHYTNKREVRIIQLSNIGDNGWKDANTKYTTFKHLELIKRSEAFPNDLIIAKMMPAGRAILCPNHEQKYVLSSDAVRFNIPDIISHRYLYHAINSPVFIDQVYGEVQGITRVRTSLQKLRNYLLPIPPKSEQDRILSALDSIEQLILQYESCRLSLDSLNKTIQDKLKKSILQEAIQGKLVPQDPNDEPAEKLLEKINAEKQRLVKEGKLKAKDAVSSVIFKGEDNKYYEQVGSKTVDISEEIIFDIPESWAWCRLGNLVYNATGLAYSKEALEVKSDSPIRVLRGGNILEGSWILKDDDILIAPEFVNEKLLLKHGTFITPAVTSIERIGKTALVREDHDNMVVGGFVLMLLPFWEDCSLLDFLLLFFQTAYYKQYCISITNKSGQAFYNISRTKLMQCLVPIPPPLEQHRIVEFFERIANTMSR